MKLSEVGAIRKQIEREYLAKVQLEHEIMSKLQLQLTADKAQKYTVKEMEKMIINKKKLVSYS